MKNILPLLCGLAFLAWPCMTTAQVNSGSNGSDGAFNPTQSVEIDMADHPDGIYQYTSVNIPSGVTVTFKPNVANKPVVWLVQGSCTILGTVRVTAKDFVGGPGGYAGGNIGGGGVASGNGLGPGGGGGTQTNIIVGGCASYATKGINDYGGAIGETYGNKYCIPLNGGSGGGGSPYQKGGGGGGAILITASDTILTTGSIESNGNFNSSGGAIRLFATHISGSGSIDVSGRSYGGGNGWIRMDSPDNTFNGGVNGLNSRGFQPIIIPPANQAGSLSIQSIGGVTVGSNPSAQLVNPDVTIPANLSNPVSIVVRCTNIAIGSEIIVDVKPVNGATIRAVGTNNSGNLSSSTATVLVTLPRGGGTIQAQTVVGFSGTASTDPGSTARSLAETGWTADGERFKAMEITAQLGSKQRITYISESGKRYPLN